MRFKRLLSLACAGCMCISLMGTAHAAEPTALETLAHMNLETASESMKSSILAARAEIIYGEQAWTVDGAVSIVHRDGTMEELPEFSELFPGWDVPEVVSTIPAAYVLPDANSNTAAIDEFFNQPFVLAATGANSPEFYTFVGTGSDVYVYTRTGPAGGQFNIGFSEGTASVGWCPNLLVNETGAVLHSDSAKIYGVRGSAANEASVGIYRAAISSDPAAVEDWISPAWAAEKPSVLPTTDTQSYAVTPSTELVVDTNNQTQIASWPIVDTYGYYKLWFANQAENSTIRVALYQGTPSGDPINYMDVPTGQAMSLYNTDENSPLEAAMYYIVLTAIGGSEDLSGLCFYKTAATYAALQIPPETDTGVLPSNSDYAMRNGAARLNLNNHAGTNGTKITSFTAEHETAIFTITNAANTQTYNVTCLDSEGNSVSNQYYTNVPLNHSVAVDHLVVGETYTFRISSNDCPASSCTATYTLQY